MQSFYYHLEPNKHVESAWTGSLLMELKEIRQKGDFCSYITKSICFTLASLAMVLIQPVITIGKTIYEFTKWDLEAAAKMVIDGWKNELFFIVSFILYPAILFYSLFDSTCFFEGFDLTLDSQPKEGSAEDKKVLPTDKEHLNANIEITNSSHNI